jgi:hypothetical protein
LAYYVCLCVYFGGVGPYKYKSDFSKKICSNETCRTLLALGGAVELGEAADGAGGAAVEAVRAEAAGFTLS